MSGSLIKIDEEIVTSAVASVTLGGIDSTYDVYMLRANNVTSTTDNGSIRARVTVSGTPDTSANYDNAYKLLNTTAFTNQSNTNMTSWEFAGGTGTGTGETVQNILYLFNFNNASQYSFTTWENATFNHQPQLYGAQGGNVHTVAQACNGIQFFGDIGNIQTGSQFVLYGLKK